MDGTFTLNHEGMTVDINVTGNNYSPIGISIKDMPIIHIEHSKPKIEVLVDLLRKMLQYRESNLAKLTLLDKDSNITNVVDDIIFKIQSELINY